MLPIGARAPIFPHDDDSGLDDSAEIIRLTNLARSRLDALPQSA